MLLNEDIVGIEKPDGICLPNFVVDEFSALFLHPSIFSIEHLRSTYITSGALSDFLHWLNSNILVSSEGLITLQKSLFSHTVLCYSSLFFFLKEWKQFKQ